VPPLEWLLPNEIFALAESSEKTARELALALIRRHYDRLGGASRLAWLMESPDRDVRLFAVRLLWEKYRQRAFELRRRHRLPCERVGAFGRHRAW